MKAVVFTKNNELKLVNDYEKPIPKKERHLLELPLPEFVTPIMKLQKVIWDMKEYLDTRQLG